MFRFGQGATGTLRGEFKDATGALVDPTTPQVDIINPSDVVVVNNAVPTRDSLGNYHYDFAVAADAPLGVWSARWSGVIDSATLQSSESFEVVEPGEVTFPGYPTLDALLAASSSPALAALELEQADALRDSAIDAIEAYTHQVFTDEALTITVPGTGTDVIYLPRRAASLESVTIDGSLLADTDWTLEDDPPITATKLRIVSPLGSTWLTRVRRPVGAGEPVFAAGARVTLVGTFGWTDADWSAGTLQAIADAIRFDMEDHAAADATVLSETVRANRALGVDQLTQGSLSVSMRAGEPGLSMRVQRKLSRWRWMGPLGGAV